MRAMSKDRDIDDILESLNQLLREGESHNDDLVESAEAPEKVKQKLNDLEDEISEVEEVDALLSVADEVVEDAPDSGSETDDDLSDAESEAETTGSWGQDEPEEGETEADCVSDDNDERLSMHRVVLTEEMLVDNPQRSLLSLVGKHSAEAELQPGDEEVKPDTAELRVDHTLMAEVLDRVGNDVIHHLQQQLPTLIKSSLEQHLNDLNKHKMTQSRASTDLPDQTEE